MCVKVIMRLLDLLTKRDLYMLVAGHAARPGERQITTNLAL